MKFAFPLCLLALSFQGAKSKNLRGFSDETCTAVLVNVNKGFDDDQNPLGEDQYLACEKPNGKSYKVKSADKDFLNKNFNNGKWKSGETTLSFGSDAKIDESTGEIISSWTPGLAKKNNPNKQKNKQSRNLAVVEGDKSVLVVRVVATNASTSASEGELSNSVFGNGVDPLNLSSQYSACSHDKLTFNKAADRTGTSTNISNGAVTITVGYSTSYGDSVMNNAIISELMTQFGVTNPNQLADHVMFCLPPGTMSGVAYAYVNSWLSVYNDNWCKPVSAQMHEIGHNLNLAHSGDNTCSSSSECTYGDQSGLMGYSYSSDVNMCFNSAKSWQLGWYSARQKTLSASGTRNYTGKLAPILDDPDDTAGAPMLLKIETGTDRDYYINFNRKAGFNSDTLEGGDQVLIVEGGEGNVYAESKLQTNGKLSAGGTWSAVVGGETVTVTVNDINTSGNGFADIEVCFGSCSSAATLELNDLDLVAIEKTGTASGKAEVHVVSKAGNYQTLSLPTEIALSPETNNLWKFLLAPNNDLYAIKKSQTGSGKTEVHVLTKASNYQSFSLRTGTALHETGDNFDFLLAPNLDIYVIKKSQTGSGKTEVHVLTKASNYSKFGLQIGTALVETGDNFEFLLAPNTLNIFAIKKSQTGSNKTEVHILTRSSNFRRFGLQTGTALPETNGDWSFAIAPNNNDVYAIKKAQTGSSSTEIHVLTRSSNFRRFGKQTGTALPETNGNWEFAIV